MAIGADVTDRAALERAYEAVDRAWGRLDVVVANAGINGVWAPIEQLDPKEWDTTIAVNLSGTFLHAQVCRPLAQATGGLGDRHGVGQRDEDLQQHRRDGVRRLEGRGRSP
jgi:NAD(P)-dependent dehydrogenase (short-subunit alcohol dehydrogenase family)